MEHIVGMVSLTHKGGVWGYLLNFPLKNGPPLKNYLPIYLPACLPACLPTYLYIYILGKKDLNLRFHNRTKN